MSIDRLHTRQIGLGIVLLLGILMFATTGSTGTNGTHEMIEWFGIFAILLCIFGRTWTSLYIGGRKNRALLTKGPYSVVRNPLYCFSILGAAGCGGAARQCDLQRHHRAAGLDGVLHRSFTGGA